MSLVGAKFREVLYSVLPITAIVLILNFTLTPLDSGIVVKFLLGTLLMVIGMVVFLLGVDISITQIGEQISIVLVKSNKLWLVLIGAVFLGTIVTIAEPDLHILAGQIEAVTSGRFNSDLMILTVSVGVGVMVAFGVLRILKNFRLNRFMTIVYLVILGLGLFTQPDFLAIAFDSSGNTTGAVSVPFILALAVGISGMTRSYEKEENDGFGILGIASTGAIIAVMIQGLITGTGPIEGSLPVSETAMHGLLGEFLFYAQDTAISTFVAIAPIIITYLVCNALWIKQPAYRLRRIAIGTAYTYLGLVVFLTGVNAGFLEASRRVGFQLAGSEQPWLLVLVGVILGAIIIPAEPSVHVLTHQIEDNTAGSIKALVVMLTLCVGVAAAVGLSMLRILIPELQLWHVLLPGMIIAVTLSYIVPDIFVGIAYDSGGVAAGTMTSVLILPFAQGAAEFIPGANIVLDGFGIIAVVAMTPLIAVMLLGLIFRLKTHPLLSEVTSNDADTEAV